MRHILSIGGVIAICVVLGLGFTLARKSRAALEPGIWPRPGEAGRGRGHNTSIPVPRSVKPLIAF